MNGWQHEDEVALRALFARRARAAAAPVPSLEAVLALAERHPGGDVAAAVSSPAGGRAGASRVRTAIVAIVAVAACLAGLRVAGSRSGDDPRRSMAPEADAGTLARVGMGAAERGGEAQSCEAPLVTQADETCGIEASYTLASSDLSLCSTWSRPAATFDTFREPLACELEMMSSAGP